MWLWLKKCNKTFDGLKSRFWSLISVLGRMGWHLALGWILLILIMSSNNQIFWIQLNPKKDIKISWKVVTLLNIGTCLSDIPFWFDDKTTVGNEFIFFVCFVCGKEKYGKNFAIWLAGWMSTHWRVQSCQRFSWRFC